MESSFRFPLLLANNEDVRSLEEFREYFDLEKVLEYYYRENNNLLNWLDNLGLEDEAEAIRALDSKAPEFPKKLCDIFEVECDCEIDTQKVKNRIDRLARLRLVTSEPEHHRNVDLVAFNQEELAKLVLEDGERIVYLCQEEGECFTFTIPSSHRNVKYIGIPCNGKQPSVRITGTVKDWSKELGIEIASCQIVAKKPLESDVQELDLSDPIQSFFDAVFQNDTVSNIKQAVVSIEFVGPGVAEQREYEIGDVCTLRKKTAHFLQEKLACGHSVSGMRLKANGSETILRTAFAVSEISQIKGVHMERESDGSRSIYADLTRSIQLNNRKFRYILIPSADVYEKLDLRNGSLVEVICLQGLPPVIRVEEQGKGGILRCPHCGKKFVVRNKSVFCENPVCFDRLHGRIFRFLEAIGLEEYDRTFVQTIITKLPVKSLKDIFKLDHMLLEEAGLNDDKSKKFPNALRRAVSEAPASVLLAKVGIPSLWKKQAQAIIDRYAAMDQYKHSQTEPIVELLRSLDNDLWNHTIGSAVGKETGNEIQYWLRCDPQSAKIFRDDLEVLRDVIAATDKKEP